MNVYKIGGLYPPAIANFPGACSVSTGSAQLTVPPGTKLSQIRWARSSEVFETTVPSSSGGEYKVRLLNGSWTCECLGYHYRRVCRHINHLKKVFI